MTEIHLALLHKIRMDLLAVLARTGLPGSHGTLIETERRYNGLERTAVAKQGQPNVTVSATVRCR
jgi:hypothetical protein